MNICKSNYLKYKYAGVFPISRNHLNQVVVLLGRERYETNWNGSEKWSDFGGGPHPTETHIESAAREAYEESMGFLGSVEDIHKLVKTNSRGKIPCGSIDNPVGYTYIVEIPFDQELPKTFNQVYQYISQTFVTHPVNPSIKYFPNSPDGWYEKTQIEWIVLQDLLNNLSKYKSELRPEFVITLKNLKELYILD